MKNLKSKVTTEEKRVKNVLKEYQAISGAAVSEQEAERITKLINNINNTQEGSTDCIIYEKYGLIAVLAGELKTICEKGDK